MEKQWRSLNEYTEGIDPHQEIQAEEKHKNAVLNVLDSSVVDAPASRRDFLKLFGFTAASAAVLSSCEKPIQKAIPYLIKPEEITPGKASYYASSFFDGTEYCSVVVKTNHGSGWNYSVHDGKHDRQALNRKVNSWMDRRFGQHHAEWGYYGVEAKLFVEEMLLEPDGQPLANEYKTYIGCDGRIALTFCRQLDETGERIDAVVDHKGCVQTGHSEINVLSGKAVVPEQYGDICRVSRVLSAPFDFVRCDLYVHDSRLYFSEFTLYSYGGYPTMSNPAVMQRLTDVWDIRASWFLTTQQTGWRRYYAACLHRLLVGS